MRFVYFSYSFQTLSSNLLEAVQLQEDGQSGKKLKWISEQLGKLANFLTSFKSS